MEALEENKISHKKILIIITSSIVFLVISAGIWYTIKNAKQNIENFVPKDFDRDLLSDEEELKLGTDPNKEDTDGDGLSDYAEVKLKTDPKKSSSITPGVSDSQVIIQKKLDEEKNARLEYLKTLKK